MAKFLASDAKTEVAELYVIATSIHIHFASGASCGQSVLRFAFHASPVFLFTLTWTEPQGTHCLLGCGVLLAGAYNLSYAIFEEVFVRQPSI
jgi:hypothetical protein